MKASTLIMYVIMTIEMVYCGEYCSSLPVKCNVTVNCWVGDGWCDWNLAGYNTPECNFDGGDCCPDTCQTTMRKHECGCNGYVCVAPIYQPTLVPTSILSLSYQPSVYSSNVPHTQVPTSAITSISMTPSSPRTEASISPTPSASLQPTSPMPLISTQSPDGSMTPSLQPDTNSPTPTKRWPGRTSPTKPSSRTSRSPFSTPVASSVVPSPLPTMESFSRQPIPTATNAPINVPHHPPFCTSTITPTMIPTRQPSQSPTRQPSWILTRQPSQSPTRQPSRIPTRQPSQSPTRQPSQIPTRQPSQSPTRQPSWVPIRLPTLIPSHLPVALPTQLPTGMLTRSPTQTPPSRPPSQAPTRPPTTPLHTTAVTYFLTNVTAGVAQEALSVYDTTAIAQSLEIVLFTALGAAVNITSTKTSVVGSVRNFTSQARRLGSQEDREQVWNVTQLLQWRNQSGMQVGDVHHAVNASLSNGSLQQEIRSQCTSDQCNLLYVVLCGSLTDSACLLMTPTVPTVVAHADSCSRSSSSWAALYDAPRRLSWYVVWLGMQGVVWMAVGVAVGYSSSRHSRWNTAVIGCTAAVHMAYSGVLLWEYFLSVSNSMACAEFKYLETVASAEQHTVDRVELILIFLRGLIYPLLLLTGICLLFRISSSSSTVVHSLGSIVAVSFAVALSVCFLLALSGSNKLLSAAQLAHITLWNQLCCGILLCISVILYLFCSFSNGREVPWTAAVPSRKTAETPSAAVLRDLEAESASADLALARSRRPITPSQQQLPVLGPPVRLPIPQRSVQPRVGERLNLYTTAIVFLVLVSSVLSIATAFPATLTVPISAILLYSVASRLCELSVVLALLSMLRYQQSRQQRGRRDPTPLWQHSAGDLQVHPHLQQQQQCASVSAEVGRVVRAESAPVSLQPAPQLHQTEAPRVNYWHKGWKWIFTPRNTAAQGEAQLESASEPANANTECSAWGVKRWQSLSRSSSSSDSTDSDGNYF